MFTRFRETARRLQVSLVETRRVAGRVQHIHVAGLGSIGVPPSPGDRIAFWTKLHQRLAALANRTTSEQCGLILAAVHGRIPVPTMDEQRAALLADAKANADFWETLRDANADNAEADKALSARLARKAAEQEAAAANAARKAQDAAERVAKAERGEDVQVARPLTRKEMLAALGLKSADLRHADRLVEIERLGGRDDLLVEITKRKRSAEKVAARVILARQRRREERACE